MSYCIYLRKSRADAEAELAGAGETLARHEKALLSLAKKQNLPIEKIYREILSGETIAGRPIMQQLLRDVEAGMWEGVLVMEVERLGRGDTMDQGILLNAFKYSGTKIVTPLKTYDPENEFDEEYFEFSQFMSRREYKTILRRMQRGREASAREGKFAGSVPPFGYRREKLEKEKGFRLAIEPQEAEAVRLAFSLYAYGDPQPDGSFAEIGRATIAKRLDELGFRNRNGGAWATASVTRMLQNPVYIGKIHWNRRPARKSTKDGKIFISRPLAEDFILAEGLHEPILSTEIWDLVQQKMQQHCRPTGIGEIKNPLAGLVRCGSCGRLMQRRPYRKSGQPAALICTTPSCPQVSSALELVEQKILEGLAAWAQQHEAAWEEPPPSDAFAEKERALSQMMAAQERELQRLQNQLETACELLERGVYPPEIFADRSRLLQQKIAQCRKSLAASAEKCRRLEQKPQTKTPALPAFATLPETYAALPPAAQNQLLKALLDHVVYQKEAGGRWHHAPDAFSLALYPKISRNF